MTTLIWKGTLPQPHPETGLVTVRLPFGAEIVSWGVQDTAIVFWYALNPSRAGVHETEQRFVCMNTGRPAPFSLRKPDHEATLTVGDVVWHIFRVGTFAG